MQTFLTRIKEKAKNDPKRIILPEGFDDRVLIALEQILTEGTAHPIILGNLNELKEQANNLNLSLDWEKIEVINPATDERTETFAKRYVELRNGKTSEEDALKEMKTNINSFGTMMVQEGLADGMVSGTTFSTAETIRPALRIIKTKEKFHKVSGFFLMLMEEDNTDDETPHKRVLLFADCAVIPEPNSHDLADIAIDTAETALRFGLKPKIAMLSFSTAGSAKHPDVDKIREATKMIQDRRPDLIVEGEMQVDAALVPSICKRKFPKAKSIGDFNILIFPDLNSGNIGYKLVQRLADAHAIGPILQGLNKPVNDLSRGCTAKDIADLVAFTTVEAQGVDQLI
jgi:phosphate acetyltransferase